MKIKNFMKYFKDGVLKYFKISKKFLNISKWNISSCIPNNKYVRALQSAEKTNDTCITRQAENSLHSSILSQNYNDLIARHC